MRIVLQRVSQASVAVDGETIASIGSGLLILLGVGESDDAATAQRLGQKCAELRIFSDDAQAGTRPGQGRFKLSLLDIAGEALVVSQFTLLADTRRGRRPSFTNAAAPEIAEPLVEAFAQALRDAGIPTQTGRFGAKMTVALTNEGPVTILLDSADQDRSRRG